MLLWPVINKYTLFTFVSVTKMKRARIFVCILDRCKWQSFKYIYVTRRAWLLPINLPLLCSADVIKRARIFVCILDRRKWPIFKYIHVTRRAWFLSINLPLLCSADVMGHVASLKIVRHSELHLKWREFTQTNKQRKTNLFNQRLRVPGAFIK